MQRGHSNGKKGYQARPWTHKKHPKLITYFSGMKIDPRYGFLHAFFLICLSCPFQNLSIWPKIHPFFQFCTFFAPLNDVCAYITWSWKTTLITWIFGWAWYPLDIRVPPPPDQKTSTRGALYYFHVRLTHCPTQPTGSFQMKFCILCDRCYQNVAQRECEFQVELLSMPIHFKITLPLWPVKDYSQPCRESVRVSNRVSWRKKIQKGNYCSPSY